MNGETPSRPVIRVEKLSKRFGKLQVLGALDLEIEAGRTTAILGPNGAGKTTLIKSILGLVIPDSGTITVAGEVVGPSPQEPVRVTCKPSDIGTGRREVGRVDYPLNLLPGCGLWVRSFVRISRTSS
jgi:ABC-type polar amino acid transport system ATPase subunit